MIILLLILNITILNALTAAFLLSLFRKVGIIEYVQVHGNDFFSKMFNCDFCLSWWINVILAIIVAIIFMCPIYLIVPFCATTLTRKML